METIGCQATGGGVPLKARILRTRILRIGVALSSLAALVAASGAANKWS
jgi:hypothetical protein